MENITLTGADIRGKMLKLKPKDGDNTVHSFSLGGTAYRLVAVVQQGRIIDWVALDPEGGRHKMTTLQVAKGGSGSGKRTCWRCFKARDGSTHCFEVPCPKGPWTPFPRPPALPPA